MEDILLDNNNRLQVADGDLVKGESDVQHQRLILACGKGAIRHAPGLGVDINNVLQDDSTDDLLIAIRTEFTNDGMNIKVLDLDGTKLIINAEYENI